MWNGFVVARGAEERRGKKNKNEFINLMNEFNEFNEFKIDCHTLVKPGMFCYFFVF